MDEKIIGLLSKSGAVQCPECGEIIDAHEVTDTFERFTEVSDIATGAMETMVCTYCNKWFVVEFVGLLANATAHKIEVK